MKAAKQLPITSCLSIQQFPYDYLDSYAVPLSRDVHASELVIALFHTAPRWVDALLALRDKAVRQFGLKTSERNALCLTPPFYAGQRFGLFELRHISEKEVVFGVDDKHLDFRTSVLVEPKGTEINLTITTLVHMKNAFGRIYFLCIQPFHRIIVPSMLKAMAQRLNAS